MADGAGIRAPGTPVPTTAGPLPATELGRTLAHEHLRCGPEGLRVQWPHLFDEDRDLAECVAAVSELAPWGVETICDPACMDLNRSAPFALAVTAATGVRFVLATGIYGAHWASLSVFMRGDVQLLQDCFMHDLTVGIQGTDVRAGFIKCAADFPGMTDDVVTMHEAVARAAVASGAPIMAHSNPAFRTGLDQMALFTAHGVAPERVQIAHTGDTDDLDYIEELLATGCFIGMDRYGLHLGADERTATVIELVRRGHARRMMLGHDSVVVMDGPDPVARRRRTPDNRLTFIFETVLPQLRAAGVGEADIDAMLGANVHAWLGG